MRTLGKIVLGCFVVPIVLAVVLVLTGLLLRKASPTVHRDETARLEQAITGVTEAQLASEGLKPADSTAAGRALPVELTLEEGNFTVTAGPPGSSIKVEGDYDAGAYELKQEMSKDGEGRPYYKLRFGPRYSMFRRMLTEGGVHIDENDNKLTVYLPRGVPISLNLQMSKGSSHLQLGGLALESAALDLSMGQHMLTVEEPNPLQMSRLELNASMGESRLKDLGNLRASDIEVWGKMGGVRVDFGNGLARDTKLIARMKMGEMSLMLPHDARLRTRTSVFLGGHTGGVPANGESVEGKGGFLLDIDTEASFGEVKYQRN